MTCVQWYHVARLSRTMEELSNTLGGIKENKGREIMGDYREQCRIMEGEIYDPG